MALDELTRASRETIYLTHDLMGALSKLISLVKDISRRILIHYCQLDAFPYVLLSIQMDPILVDVNTFIFFFFFFPQAK